SLQLVGTRTAKAWMPDEQSFPDGQPGVITRTWSAGTEAGMSPSSAALTGSQIWMGSQTIVPPTVAMLGPPGTGVSSSSVGLAVGAEDGTALDGLDGLGVGPVDMHPASESMAIATAMRLRRFSTRRSLQS